MKVLAILGFGLLGFIAGVIAGGAMGLGGGLAYTSLAATSGFEGYSGFVVLYWILAGGILGALAGAIGLPAVVAKRNRPPAH